MCAMKSLTSRFDTFFFPVMSTIICFARQHRWCWSRQRHSRSIWSLLLSLKVSPRQGGTYFLLVIHFSLITLIYIYLFFTLEAISASSIPIKKSATFYEIHHGFQTLRSALLKAIPSSIKHTAHLFLFRHYYRLRIGSQYALQIVRNSSQVHYHDL